jgi:O-antigen/teichoic acid export membrane protein
MRRTVGGPVTASAGSSGPIVGLGQSPPQEAERGLPRQAIAVVLVRGLGLALAFSLNIVLARLMGAEGFGIYSFAISVLVILQIFSVCGLDGVLVREVAASRELGRSDRLKGVIIFGVAAIVLLSIAVSSIVLLVVRAVAPAQWPYAATLLIGLLALAPMALLGGIAAILEALRLPVPAQVAESIIRPCLFVALVGIYVLPLDRHLTPEIAAVVHVLAYVGALLVAVGYLLGRIRRDIWTASATITPRIWLAAAAGFALTNAAYVITEKTDVIMLAALADPEAVGIYRAAARCAHLVSFALLATMLPLRPAISAAFARGNDKRAQGRAMRTAARFAMAIGLPAAVLLIAFGDTLLAVFGNEFSRGRMALTILVLGQLVNVAAGSVGVLMTMTGHEKRVAATVSASAGCNVVMNLVLIPRFGIEGAAVATAISLVLWNAVTLHWVIKHLRINPTIFGPRLDD